MDTENMIDINAAALLVLEDVFNTMAIRQEVRRKSQDTVSRELVIGYELEAQNIEASHIALQVIFNQCSNDLEYPISWQCNELTYSYLKVTAVLTYALYGERRQLKPVGISDDSIKALS